jgi:hypothetical protein
MTIVLFLKFNELGYQNFNSDQGSSFLHLVEPPVPNVLHTWCLDLPHVHEHLDNHTKKSLTNRLDLFDGLLIIVNDISSCGPKQFVFVTENRIKCNSTDSSVRLTKPINQIQCRLFSVNLTERSPFFNGSHMGSPNHLRGQTYVWLTLIFPQVYVRSRFLSSFPSESPVSARKQELECRQNRLHTNQVPVGTWTQWAISRLYESILTIVSILMPQKSNIDLKAIIRMIAWHNLCSEIG